jgi:hypothetical protein
MPALIPPCCRRFVPAWWSKRQRRCDWTGCCRCARTVAGSQREARNAPTQPMWWHGSVRSRSSTVWEKPCAALDDRASLAPDWVLKQITPDWCERDSHRAENDRVPKSESQRTALVSHIGADGRQVLTALEPPDAPAQGKALNSVHILRQVWTQDDEVSGGKATWRAGPCTDDGEGVIRSPDDPEAHTGTQRDPTWLGSNVHLTDTGGRPEEPLRP